MIRREQWKNLDQPHKYAKFRLLTKVGKVVVSTVGEFEWLLPSGLKTLFPYLHGHVYETMVFKVVSNPRAKQVEFSCAEEYDTACYDTAKDARKGHFEMCKEWAKEKNQEKVK